MLLAPLAGASALRLTPPAMVSRSQGSSPRDNWEDPPVYPFDEFLTGDSHALDAGLWQTHTTSPNCNRSGVRDGGYGML